VCHALRHCTGQGNRQSLNAAARFRSVPSLLSPVASDLISGLLNAAGLRNWSLELRRAGKTLNGWSARLWNRPRQQNTRGVAHNELAAGCREDWHETDFRLRLADVVNGNPDAIGRA
jgi:hypothetical protein